ncbi:hypothetical protein K2173_023442 [Erythroxylum novogranatense]|uniref:RING-type E3 ubiquitin transferase n=1 Tax=Erythroxylum novogranatense TaxID=1862640 RepID=A0AAV8TVU5_9ROSI|nr:hypothetical protein K2173_023442 [Erythroxylum novogranatense]
MTRFRVLESNSSMQTRTKIAEPPEAANVESDMVIIMAALISALICMVGMITVIRCSRVRNHGSSSSGLSSSQQQHASANKGLKKKILKSLPKYTYSKSIKATDKEANFQWTECAICLAEFVEGEEVRVLPGCGHTFHVSCIDVWLESHSSCPSCRQILAVVSRCQKCGHFPAISSSSGGGNGTVMAESDRAALNVKEEASSVNLNIHASHDISFLP